MAARLNDLLNPILRSHTAYASSLNYKITLEGFSDRCSVKDAQLAECINKDPTRARVKSQQEQ